MIFCLVFDVKLMKIATGSAQANKQVESVNRSLDPMRKVYFGTH